MSKTESSSAEEQDYTDRPPANAVGAREWLILGCVVTGFVLAICAIVGALAFFAASSVDEESSSEPEPTSTPDPTTLVDEDETSTSSDGLYEADTVIESGDYDVQSGQVNWFLLDNGSLYVFGEIINNSNVRLQNREIMISVRDAEGLLIDNGRAALLKSLADPGMTVPFTYRIDLEVDDIEGIAVEVEVMVSEPSEDDVIEFYDDFDVLQATWREDVLSGSVIGEVTNVGDQSAEYVIVFVAGYDDDDRLQFVETTYAERDVVAPGERTPFNVRFVPGNPGEPAELQVWAEGWVVED